MESSVFYAAPTADGQYAVLAANASGPSACVSIYPTEDEAEKQCDLMNSMSGAEEEMEDVPEEMFILLDQLS